MNDLWEPLLHYVFVKAQLCRREHNYASGGFCPTCVETLSATLASLYVLLTDTDICAILRQLHRQPIPHDGLSGPGVHQLHARLVAFVGSKRYAEMVDGPWPDSVPQPNGPETGQKHHDK